MIDRVETRSSEAVEYESSTGVEKSCQISTACATDPQVVEKGLNEGVFHRLLNYRPSQTERNVSRLKHPGAIVRRDNRRENF